MRGQKGRWGLLAVLLASTWLGCGPESGDSTPLRIGVIADRDASQGRDTLEAIELAHRVLLEDGGVERPEGRRPVEIQTAVVATPEEALAAARQMSLDGIVALVGPSISRHAIPVATVADFAQLPMISPKSTHPMTTDGKSFAFRVAFTDAFQGRVLARFARDRLAVSTVAVLYDAGGDYNRSIAQVFGREFERRGGVVAEEVYAPGEVEFAGVLSRLLDHEPELVFLPNYHDEVILQARQARALGFLGPFLGGDGWAPGALDEPALEGSYFCQHWHPEATAESSLSRAFVEGFEERFGRPPNDLAALSYDAIALLFGALAQAPGPSALEVRNTLASTRSFDGVTGRITDDGRSGNPSKPALILQIGPAGELEPFDHSPAPGAAPAGAPEEVPR